MRPLLNGGTLGGRAMGVVANRIRLAEALRAALLRTLPDGWLYLPEAAVLTPDTVCLLVDDPDAEDGPPEAMLKEFPHEGLSTDLMEDTGEAARLFMDPPSDLLLIESFDYYRRFDAFLPKPGAPEPPPWEETQGRLDREFVALLGPERASPRCRHEQCDRGAVSLSALCRKHHFESIQRRPYPFDD